MKRNLFLYFLLFFIFQLQAADYYWVGGSGNWSDINHWATTSGGSTKHSIVPGSSDNVYFDANSGLLDTSIVDFPAGNAFCLNMSWVGVTTTPLFRNNTSFTLYISGNLELSSSVRYAMQRIEFTGTGDTTYRTNGAARVNVAGWYNPFIVNKPGGSLTLLDDIPEALVVSAIILINGHLDLSGNNHTIQSFNGNNTNVRSLDISNSQLTLTGTWDFRGTNSTLISDGSYINTVQFHSDAHTFPKVDINIGNNNSMSINNTVFSELTFTSTTGTPGNLRIGGNNTIERLEFKSNGLLRAGGNTIDELIVAPGFDLMVFQTNTITTLLQLNTPNCSGLGSITGNTNGTLNFLAGATIDLNNVYIQEMTATGGITLPINVTGADGGGNTGWTFQAPATGTTLYWVGGAGDWNDKNHWSATSGGAGGYCVPFLADDVVFDQNSGFTAGDNTVTTSSNTWYHDMTWENVTGAPVFNASSSYKMEIWGDLVMNSTVTMNAKLQFSGKEMVTMQTNGSGLGAFNIRIDKSDATGGVTLLDNLINPETRIEHSTGQWLMPGRTMNIHTYESGGGERTIDITNATIVVNDWSLGGSGRTWIGDAAGSFITANERFVTRGLYYPRVHCTTDRNFLNIANTGFGELIFTNPSPTSLVALASGNTIETLEFKGSGSIGFGNTINNLSLAHSKKYFFTGTNTINDHLLFNSPSCEGLGEMRGLNGTTATLNFGPASSLDIDNVYLQDMTASGNGVPITVNGADAGGNSGFNITTSTGGARYWVGGAGDWNDSSHWSDTPGGAGGACVPTVDNDVYFDANSFLSGGSTVTVSNGNAYCRNMDWTGATNNPVFSKDPLLDMEIWGNLVMNPSVSMTTNNRLLFVGTSNTTITTNGSTLGDFDFKIKKASTSSIVKVLDDMSNPLTRIELERGGLDLSGTTVSIEGISDINTPFATSIDISNTKLALAWSYSGNQKSLTATGSEITAVYFYANGGIYNKVDIQTVTSNRITVTNSTFSEIVFSNASPTSAAHISGGNTIDQLEFKGAGYINGSGNTIGTLIFSPGKKYTLLSGSTNTVTGDWFGSGTPCNLTEISSSSTANATITNSAGTVDFDYIRLKGITADSPTPFIANEHSIDQGGNVNWTISPYNGSAPITGLGPDLALTNAQLPYTLTTDGFFGSPLSQYTWTKDGNVMGTGDELIVSEEGAYSVLVEFVDGCSISDDIIITFASADLSIVKIVDNASPAINEDVVFTLVVANNGPALAQGITATDQLPTGYTLVSSTLPTGTTYDETTGVWTIGDLAVGANVTMTITAKVNATGTYLNTATITSTADDPDGTNNSDSVDLVPNAPAIVTQPSCAIETGTIEIQALTDGTYSIDGGVTFVPTNIFPDLTPGDYTLATKIGTLTSTPETVTINEPPIIPDAPISGGDQQICETDPLQTLTATATVPTGSTITWYDAATDGNVVASPVLNTVGSIIYYAETNNGICASKTRTAVSLSINAKPVLNIQNPAVACHPNTIDLTVPGITNGNPEALDLSYFTDAAATTTLSLPAEVSVSGTYYIKGTDAITGCSDVKPVIVQFVDRPEVTTVHPDCVIATGGINITSPLGTSFEYSIDNGLTYENSTAFIDLGPGTYNVLARNTMAPGCVSDVNTIVINATPTTATPTVYQPGCGETEGRIEFIENADYEYAIDGGSFVGGHTFTLAPGSYSIQSKKAGEPCEASPVVVVINTSPIRPTAPTATDQQVCETGGVQTLTATATVEAGSNLTWYDAASGGNLVNTPTLSGVGSITFYAETDNGTCTSEGRTAVTLTIVPLPVINPIADMNACSDITLPAITGSNLSGNEAYYTAPNGGGTAYNVGDLFSILGETTLYAFDNTTVSSPALSCPTEVGFKVTVNPEITLNTISSDQDVCMGSSPPLEIQGSTPIGGDGNFTYVWEQSVDDGISWSATSGHSTETILDPDPLTQETLFRRTVSSGGCTSVSNSVKMTIIDFPIGNDATVTTLDCTGTLAYDLQSNVNDIANGGNGITGTFAWTAMPNPNVVGASDGTGSVLSQTLINTGATLQQQKYLVAASNATGLCPSQFFITVNVPVCASLIIDKTADVSSVDTAGDVINYTIRVTNTGSAVHSNVVVNDPLLGGNLTDKTGDNGNNLLEDGEVWVYSGAYTVTQTDLDNNGNLMGGSGMIHNTAVVVTDQITTPITATTDVPIVFNPEIALIKTAEIAGTGLEGEVITYTFTVTNTGNVTLSNILVDDILTDTVDLAVTPSTLPPGETGTATATYIIAPADIIAGNVTNSALVKGYDPDGNEVGDISGTDIDNDDPTINIVSTKDPEAYDDSAETGIGQAVDINIMGNDIAHDTHLVPGSIEIINGPSHGTLSIDSDGIIVYTPSPGSKFTGEDTFTYRVRDGNGAWTNVATVTITITGLFLPNAITPNGDGDNDTFEIVGIENYDKVEVTIYNRWGNQVYRNVTYNNEFAAKDLSDGTYYYIIDLTDKQGRTQNHKGWLFVKH